MGEPARTQATAAPKPLPRFPVVDELVVQTFVVFQGRTFSHYEIHLAPTPDLQAPRRVLLTNDDALYVEALRLEGSDERIDAAWRAGKRRDGRVAQVLTAMRRHREAA